MSLSVNLRRTTEMILLIQNLHKLIPKKCADSRDKGQKVIIEGIVEISV